MSSNTDQQHLVPKSRKQSIIIKRVVIAIVVIVTLLIISFGVWYFIDLNNKNQKQTENTKILEKAQQSFEKYNEASTKAVSGDYAAGQSILDEEIISITDSVDKARIYLQKSSIAYNSDKFDDAYNFAIKAEELFPDSNSAKMIAAAAAKRGDIKDATAKYQLAISRITGTSESDETDRQSIRDSIKLLEEQK